MNILQSLRSLDERAQRAEASDPHDLIRGLIRPLINLVMAQEQERLELIERLDAQQGKPSEAPGIKRAESILG